MKRILLFCLLPLFLIAFYGKTEASQVSKPPEGTVSIQIDPLLNQLVVLINGVPYKKYLVALGTKNTPTPVGEWKVVQKSKDWGSGFGTRWIGLNVPWGIYGIHGTNRPHTIGHDASHGCVRMFNRNVEELYEWVRIGTPVSIIGHGLGEPWVNSRRLAVGDSGLDVQMVQSRLRSAGFFKGNCDGRFRISTEQALKGFEKKYGLPVDGVVSEHDYIELGLVE